MGLYPFPWGNPAGWFTRGLGAIRGPAVLVFTGLPELKELLLCLEGPEDLDDLEGPDDEKLDLDELLRLRLLELRLLLLWLECELLLCPLGGIFFSSLLIFARMRSSPFLCSA